MSGAWCGGLGRERAEYHHAHRPGCPTSPETWPPPSPGAGAAPGFLPEKSKRGLGVPAGGERRGGEGSGTGACSEGGAPGAALPLESVPPAIPWPTSVTLRPPEAGPLARRRMRWYTSDAGEAGTRPFLWLPARAPRAGTGLMERDAREGEASPTSFQGDALPRGVQVGGGVSWCCAGGWQKAGPGDGSMVCLPATHPCRNTAFDESSLSCHRNGTCEAHPSSGQPSHRVDGGVPGM